MLDGLAISKSAKMKTIGATLFFIGVVILVYSIIYGSSSMGFWSMYLGMILVVTGLGFLGMNVGFPY